MIFQYEDIKFNIEYFSEFDPEKRSILFLHGFTGSAKDWKDISGKLEKRFNKIAIDLIGHGKSDSPPNVKFYLIDSIIGQIEQIIIHLQIKEIIVCGYSMGGRVALNFALRKPHLVNGLILEGTSAGIKTASGREERKKSDDELANYIEKNSTEDFIKKWIDQELFGTLKRFSNKRIEEIKISKYQNSKIGLVNSLKGFGTGVMTYLESELIKLKIPVLLITGGLDEKFTQINQRIKKSFPSANHKIISSAGHNTHLEEPKRFIEAVNLFLKQF